MRQRLYQILVAVSISRCPANTGIPIGEIRQSYNILNHLIFYTCKTISWHWIQALAINLHDSHATEKHAKSPSTANQPHHTQDKSLLKRTYTLYLIKYAQNPVMMMSSNGNIFGITSYLCGEFTGPGEFPAQWPVTRNFDVFFHLRPNKRLSTQWWGWWLETPLRPLWRRCNIVLCFIWDGLTHWGRDKMAANFADKIFKWI